MLERCSFFLKSLSRSVHDEEEHHDQTEYFIKTQSNFTSSSSSLTVWRKSLIMSCNGFTVIDSNGNLVYRVDNYIGDRPKELILMDGPGKSILTMQRSKKLRLVDCWLIYEGEVSDYFCTSAPTKSAKKPIFCVKKGIKILQGKPNVLAYVYRGSSEDRRYVYVIEGSYAHRSCKVLDESKRVVTEIKRKDATMDGVSYGLEVFLLVVQPGFDPGFAMALVLLLDQMFS